MDLRRIAYVDKRGWLCWSRVGCVPRRTDSIRGPNRCVEGRTLRICLVGAATVFTMLGCRNPATDSETKSQEKPAALSLRLVTWNIQKCEGGLDAVTSELSAMRPDVVLLQESIEPAAGSSCANQTQQIAAALMMQAVSSCGRLDDERRQCIAVLSRFPIRESKELSAADDRAYALAATIDMNGQPATVVCVHLAGTWKLDLRHVAETSTRREQECRALADWAATQTQPTIIAGDFNPVSVEAISTLARRIRQVDGIGATFPSQFPAMTLDRAFASSHWSVQAVDVIDSQSADHRPVFVELNRIENR